MFEVGIELFFVVVFDFVLFFVFVFVFVFCFCFVFSFLFCVFVFVLRFCLLFCFVFLFCFGLCVWKGTVRDSLTKTLRVEEPGGSPRTSPVFAKSIRVLEGQGALGVLDIRRARLE